MIFFCQEWEHSPVDQVRTVTLCCILCCDVCPSAKYFLTGSCLLTSRSVSWFYCEDCTSDTKVTLANFRICLVDLIHHRFQFCKCIYRTFICFNCFLSFLYFFRTSDICRVFSGKSELCKSQRIRTVRRCLSGRNQLICCCNRIMDLRYNLHKQILWKC